MFSSTCQKKNNTFEIVCYLLLCPTELQGQVNQMTSDLKEERVAGKRVRAQLQQLQDDHGELVAERDSLHKVCSL